MYMTLEYNPLGTGVAGHKAPVSLGVKVQDPDGPKFADVAWDPDVKPMRVDDDTYMISTDVSVNGTRGLAAFVMQAAKLLSVRIDHGSPVEIRSVKFSQSPGTPGFALDGVPKIMPGECPDPERAGIQDYFDRNGLFTVNSDRVGGMYVIWFDRDVTWEAVQEFLKRHPVNSLGIFTSAVQLDDDKKPAWSLCYLFAHPDHLNHDLSRWRSDDRRATMTV